MPIDSHNRHIAKQMSGPGASGVVGRMDELKKEQNGRGAEKKRQFGQFDADCWQSEPVCWQLGPPLVWKDYRLLFTSKYTSAWRPGALSTQHNPTWSMNHFVESWLQLAQCQINLGAKQAVVVALQFCIWQWYLLSMLLSTTLSVRIEKSSCQFLKWSAKNTSPASSVTMFNKYALQRLVRYTRH